MPKELYTAQSKPNVIYVHFNDNMEPIYVGCTSDPKRRPHLKKGRPWMKSGEFFEVWISPAMPYESAAWIEDLLIRLLRPKYNKANGRDIDTDPRVRQIADAAKVSYTQATEMKNRWEGLSEAEFSKRLANYSRTVEHHREQNRKYEEAVKGMSREEREAYDQEKMTEALEALSETFAPFMKAFTDKRSSKQHEGKAA